MPESLILPKTNYPAFCPGLMELCTRIACDVIYDWRNVFVSIRYGDWFSDFRKVIEDVLLAGRFTPVVVERGLDPIPLTEAIAKAVCRSAHAIIDLSTDDQGGFAGGVLMENGFICCTMGRKDILLVTRQGANLPAAAQARGLWRSRVVRYRSVLINRRGTEAIWRSW